MKRLSKLRFDALAGYIRSPYSVFFASELDWFQAGDEKLLGVVSIDTSDLDYAAAMLARDKRGRFRAVKVKVSLPFREEAIGRLHTMMATSVDKAAEDFSQGDEVGSRTDFFAPSVDRERMATAFRLLLEERGYTPARGILDAMTYYFDDPDGNFVQQFQTTGFDARCWELYLYAAFTELGYAFDRQCAAPDLHCVGPEGDFFVEATTVNPSNTLPEVTEDNREQYFSEYVPMKFGSALRSKLVKRYWELPHVQGKPLVLAIQDFHAPGAMTWSNTALREYLYGIRQNEDPRSPGKVTSQRIHSYKWKDKTIPAGFFNQPDTEHISAVIANPEGTISKFNRMGFIGEFGDREIHMIRRGMAYQGQTSPAIFVASVEDGKYTESWCQGLEVFHNPKALIPLPEFSMPGVAHTTVRGDQIVSNAPPFFPVGSMTVVMTTDQSFTDNSQEQGKHETESTRGLTGPVNL